MWPCILIAWLALAWPVAIAHAEAAKITDANGLAFSPDGKVLAVSRTYQGLDIIDSQNGQRLGELRQAEEFFSLPAFSPDGKTVASAGKDGAVKLWNWRTGQLLWTFAAPEGQHASDLAFAPDGRCLAVTLYPGVFLIDATTGQGRLLQAGHGHQIAFSPNGRTLACSSGLKVYCWDMASGKLRNWTRIADDPDPHMFTGRCGVGMLQTQEAMAYGRDGAIYCGPGEEHAIFAVRPATRKLARITPPPTDNKKAIAVTSFALSADGRLLALGDAKGGIQLVETLTCEVRTSWLAHQTEVLPLTFSRDGRRLASADRTGELRIWELTLPTPLQYPASLADAWTDLGGDASRAHQAMNFLAHDPTAAVDLLTDRLPAPANPSDERLRNLIDGLTSADYATRTQAAEELERIGHAAAPDLRQALEADTTLETRCRIEQILGWIEQVPYGEDDRRIHRAIELLESLDTPEANQLLRRFAAGPPTALRTQLAMETLPPQSEPGLNPSWIAMALALAAMVGRISFNRRPS